ncbi:MAG: acetate--CoA ligase family protein [Microbacteriaceae bacterium]|nr:acetate--CoA ligase family protein [Microbacteriaceae bacterium]MCL2794325.1 acetate--CoA ligase family protein [Microbacteriaceae bacterium]
MTVIDDVRADGVTLEQIQTLFNPRTIALIGATDKSVWSLSIYKNLLNSGYAGEVYLVNPKGIEVHGVQSYPSIAALPERVDLAFVMVGTGVVLQVMQDVADAGIPAAVVLTSGFGEVGAEGARLEAELVRIAQEGGVTILGPNGNGYVNLASNTIPYGLAISGTIRSGGIGVGLQSGALASAVIQLIQTRNAGLSLLCSMGNESMVSLTDVMRYLVADEATKVLALFIESIRKPEEFREIAQAALAAGKPIVALKVGRSVMGAKAAQAHTGSLVGDDAVMDAVFRQAGVIRVNSLEDLIVTADLLASTGPLPGPRVGFVTPSGGACELISDRSEDEGIEIPEFTPETIARLKEVLPDFAAARNPIDVTGYILIDGTLAIRALETVDDDPNIDEIVYIAELPHVVADHDVAVERFARQAEVMRNTKKPVIVISNTLVDITPAGREVAAAAHFPTVVGGMHHGIAALGAAIRWSEQYRAARAQSAAPAIELEPLEVESAPGEVFAERRASLLLAENGVPTVPHVLVTSADQAADAAEQLGCPVVIKLHADEIAHKSDIGGVKLNIASADAARTAFEQVVEAGRTAGVAEPAALVQPMRGAGVELIVGVVRDPQWGPVLAVGLGGIWVEVFKDSTLHMLPVTHEQVKEGLRSLRSAKLLEGARGTQAADLDAVADAVVAVSELAQRLGDRLESLEINPLLVRGSDVEALDALITWR